ncbi:sulfite exporter TauE/SafE family protein [Oceaniglobus trochenteri]|uniref:sulfite exporter TauE/SafE family protein n=1 Tax=Oceaniglobus trochenteri TaxID=2763260 RepID=UPI001CFFEBF8|nr:sulfite exporter TauE/SafE family protein [Oceaniglobus trochenteri]
MSELVLFFVAGIVGGIVNAAAGGAKLFVFPMLLASGMPPLMANATGAVGMWPAQIAAVWVNRKGLFDTPGKMFAQMLPALVGGFCGAVALIFSSEKAFLAVIPALLLLAVGAILLGKRLTVLMQRAFPGGRLQKVSHVLMFAVGFYGGYFGAGLGFMLIAVLSVAGGLSMQKANTLKNLTAFFIYSVAVVPLSVSGLVDWGAAGTVLVGGLIGGYAGGYIVKYLPDTPMRIAVAGLGLVLVVSYLFL